jgi:hypothetical protein
VWYFHGADRSFPTIHRKRTAKVQFSSLCFTAAILIIVSTAFTGRELPADTVSRPVQEACLRVSTPQRGGVWVTGRRLGERYLYMVIERCVKMNDMYAAFEQLVDLLQK